SSPIFSSSGILQKDNWQGKVVYNQRQKDILQAWFEHNPYPDKATRKQLAKETGIPESKIQTWFKNHRVMQRQLESRCSLGKGQSQGKDQHQPWTQEYFPKETRQDQTSIKRFQSTILVQAFERNRFPDITTRKKLAKQTGIRESRIQMWFKNQRCLYPEQPRSEPVNSLVDGPNRRPDQTAPQRQINLSTLPGWSHFPSTNSSSRNQTFLPALLPSHVSSVPCMSQGPSVMTVQPMQAVQRGATSSSPLTHRNYLPILPAPGGDLSGTQTPSWPQNKEKCQNAKDQTGTGILQFKDYSQPHPEHRKHQLRDLGQVDISYITQRWDEACQALIAEWDPRRDMLRQPYACNTQSAGEPPHPLSQLHQQYVETSHLYKGLPC
ncbi:double homeobox protein B, partial [Manis pentadactyla]|uniref:double homeobox protein B n=1 Tax=Manis pentadactyla TaxID=143292 RepID=UPI00255C8FE2